MERGVDLAVVVGQALVAGHGEPQRGDVGARVPDPEHAVGVEVHDVDASLGEQHRVGIDRVHRRADLSQQLQLARHQVVGRRVMVCRVVAGFEQLPQFIEADVLCPRLPEQPSAGLREVILPRLVAQAHPDALRVWPQRGVGRLHRHRSAGITAAEEFAIEADGLRADVKPQVAADPLDAGDTAPHRRGPAQIAAELVDAVAVVEGVDVPGGDDSLPVLSPFLQIEPAPEVCPRQVCEGREWTGRCGCGLRHGAGLICLRCRDFLRARDPCSRVGSDLREPRGRMTE